VDLVRFRENAGSDGHPRYPRYLSGFRFLTGEKRRGLVDRKSLPSVALKGLQWYTMWYTQPKLGCCNGATGARFPSVERLARVVQVDPAELLTSDLPSGAMNRGAFGEISAKLSSLPESDLVWISALLDVALLRGREQSIARSKRQVGRIVAKPTRSAVIAKKKNR
jgi:hypothetical protein